MNDIYKTKLEEEKNTLVTELSAIGLKDPKTGDWQPVPFEETSPEADENDLADRSEDFEERTSMVAILKAKLKEVEAALERIANGNYGKCTECGVEIPKERLDANASAAKCMAHA